MSSCLKALASTNENGTCSVVNSSINEPLKTSKSKSFDVLDGNELIESCVLPVRLRASSMLILRSVVFVTQCTLQTRLRLCHGQGQFLHHREAPTKRRRAKPPKHPTPCRRECYRLAKAEQDPLCAAFLEFLQTRGWPNQSETSVKNKSAPDQKEGRMKRQGKS